MADENSVEIIYEAVVRGMQNVENLSRQNEQLQSQAKSQAETIKRLTTEHQKHESALLKARSAIQAFRRELFAVAFTTGLVVGGLKLMGNESDRLSAKLEAVSDRWRDMLRRAGDFLVGGVNRMKGIKDGQDPISRSARINQLSLEAQTARLAGDQVTALEKTQEAERIKILENGNKEKERLYGDLLRKKQEMEREDLRLTELGLKRQAQIYKDFVKETVGAFKGGTADTLFNFLQGERQTAGDVLRNFTTGINRAISNALSESLFTSIAGGGGMGGFFQNFTNALTGKKPELAEAQKTNARLAEMSDLERRMADCICSAAETLRHIEACTCATAEAIGGRIPTSATVQMPGASTAQKIASIAGLVGSVAGLGGMVSGGFGGGGSTGPGPMFPPDGGINPGGVPPSAGPGGGGPSFNYQPGPILHSGGFIHKFPSGGEVPIMAQPGEFVVRRTAASENKDLLKSINSGSRQSRSAQNVYFINANDAKSFSDMLSSPSARAQLEMQITRAIMANGQLRDTIKNFGRG